MKLRLIAIMFAGLAPAWAVDVDLPIFESNKFCPVITGASGTPIRITCNIAHHLTDNDKVRIATVYGNTAANGTFYVDVITSTTFDLYTSSGPTGAVASNGTWGTGTAGSWGGLQFASKVTPVAIKAHPRLGVDPDGNLIKMAASVGNGLLTSIVDSGTTAEATYTRAHGLAVGQKICVFSASDTDLNCSSTAGSGVYFTITAVPSSTKIQWTSSSVTDATYNNSDLTVSAWAHGGNPYWLAANTTKATNITYSSSPLANYQMNEALNMAIICYVNRLDTSTCAAAKAMVLKVEAMGTNFGCDETSPYCYDGKTDYIGGYLKHWAIAYTLTEWNLSGGEKTTIAEKLFNDLDDGCSKGVRTPLTGTSVSAPYPGGSYGQLTSTLTGVGTSFLSQLQVGSAIVPKNGIYFGQDGQVGMSVVTAVTDDTHATITGHCVSSGWLGGCTVITSANASDYAAIAPWSSGKCGALWYTKHHGGTPFGQPNLYPQGGGSANKDGVTSMNNMVVNRTSGILHAALAMADVSAKARSVFSAYAGLYANMTWPVIQGFWSASDSMGGSYSYTRGRPETVGLAMLFKYGLVGGPDLTTDTLFNEQASFNRFIIDPNFSTSFRKGAWAWGADGGRGFFELDQQFPYAWAANIAMNPTDPEVAKTAYFFRNKMFTGGNFFAGMMFFLTDVTATAADYTSGPTQRLWAYPNRTACLANGYYSCGPTGSAGAGAVISRKSWTTTSDSVVGMEVGAYYSDHAVQRTGQYVINRGGAIMIAPYDSGDGNGSAGVPVQSKGNELVPTGLSYNDGEYAFSLGVQSIRPHYGIMERWRGGLASHEGNSDNKVAYWRLDSRGGWQSGVTTMTRDMAHLKASGKQEYVLVWDHVVTATARRIDGYHHWKKNGGLITCPSGDTSCTNLNTNKQIDATTSAGLGSYTLSSKVIAPTSSNIFLSVGASFPTGYTGGNGNTARLDICAGSGSCSSAGTSLEYLVVHKLGTSVAATEFNPNSDWLGVQLTDWTVLKARGTSTFTSIPSVTTSATTNYFGIGLTAGTYEVRLGGTPVSGCTSIPVVAGDSTILCEGVGAGAITVVQTGAGPDPISISTTTLPDGVQNSSYSQTLTITGGTPAFNCTISAGSLPAGMLISVATISGIPSGSGVSSFTVSCTDSLGATPDTQAFTITIDTAGAPTNITSTTLPDGTQNSAYSQTITITGGTPPYACSIIVGSLPAGLSISVATISGTPSGIGTSSFTVSCTDSLGGTPDTQALSILINPAPGVGTSSRVGGNARVGGNVRIR